MKKKVFLLLLITICLKSYSQCVQKNEVIEKIMTDFISNSIIKAKIYTISITTNADTTYYLVSSINTVRELNEHVISNYKILKTNYILINDSRCLTLNFIKDDKSLYETLRKFCFNDETTNIDANGDEHITMMNYDPSVFMWREVNGVLINREILNP